MIKSMLNYYGNFKTNLMLIHGLHLVENVVENPPLNYSKVGINIYMNGDPLQQRLWLPSLA